MWVRQLGLGRIDPKTLVVTPALFESRLDLSKLSQPLNHPQLILLQYERGVNFIRAADSEPSRRRACQQQDERHGREH
jgi:hypothetical protein